MNSKFKIAVIVPTYNEAQNLKLLVPELFKQLPGCYVIIVDDNSRDKTEKLLENYKRKYKNLVFIKREKKDGRGTAVFYGFDYAIKKINPDFLIEMDADFSHDPKEINKLVEAAGSKTIVVGSRYIRGAEVVNIPFKRKVLSKTANTLIKILLSLPARDNTDGYRLYSKKAVEILLKHKFVSRGFVRIPESAYVLTKKGFKIKEVPIRFVDRTRGGSKVSAYEIFTWIRDIMKIRLSV